MRGLIITPLLVITFLINRHIKQMQVRENICHAKVGKCILFSRSKVLN